MGNDTDIQTQDEQAVETTDRGMSDEDRTALEDKVAAGLKAISDDGDGPEFVDGVDDDGGSDADESEAERAEDEVDIDALLDDTDADEGDDTDPKEAAAEEVEVPNTDADAPTLPDNVRRTLLANQWTEEEIDSELSKPSADAFVEMANRAHRKRNEFTAQMAERGRLERQQEQQGGNVPAADAQPSSGLQPFDTKALKEKYGEDELIDELVGPLNKAIETLNSRAGQMEQFEQTQAEHRLQGLMTTVNHFFEDSTLAPFHDLYGTPDGTLTESQKMKRNEVLDKAYCIMAGSEAMTGQPVAFEDALRDAHSLITVDYQGKKVRESIKKEAKKRAGAVSHKPTTGNPSRQQFSMDGPPQSRDELEARTRRRLAALGM